MSDVIDRRVTLGGETRLRGIIAGDRNRLEWAGMVATGLWAVPLVVGGAVSLARVLAAVACLGVAFFAWTPFPGPLAGRSVAAAATWEVRHQLRRRGAGAVFIPAYAQDANPGARAARFTRARGAPAPAFEVPAPVGNVRALSVRLASGEVLAVVRHSNPGRAHFFTACLEMQGATGGLEREHLVGRAHTDWGNFCAALAREGSFIRTVQQVSRVVPYDTADHTMWIASRIPAATDPALVASYIALLDAAAVTTEQHRTWLVLRLPVTPAFSLSARRLGDGEDGELHLVAREVTSAMARAGQYDMALRPLDTRRLAGVLRSLQDADHPIDKIAGLDFAHAWLPWDCRARGKVVVAGALGPWHTRTAVVPAHGLEAGRFSPDFLHPLLSNVSPSVVRTISTVIDLVPAHVARAKAKRDVTLDAGSSREAATRVSDGSEDQQLTASQQRLTDLRAGTRNHGAGWSMTITFCARTDDELDAATRQIEGAAEEANITGLRFLDTFHDAGLTASLPLARGLAVRR